MHYSGEMHRAIIESLIETCKQSLEDGPSSMLTNGFRCGHESEHTNGGYLTMDTLIYFLHRVLTNEKPQNRQFHGILFCGAINDFLDLRSQQEAARRHDPLGGPGYSLNGNISSLNPDLAYYCRLCLMKINMKASILASEDKQEFLPWCIIKYILSIYSYKFTDVIVSTDCDPYHSSRIDRILEGIVERVPGGPSTNCEWLISASCSSARVNWMNDLFEELFIKSGDHSEPTWPGWRGTNNPEEISDFTEEDICTWWSTEMRIPTNVEFWGNERPRPPNHTPPSRRPVIVEPVNETKKKLTEMFAFVEENRETWKMSEGDFLKLSNLMKEAFDSV
jgi:hypothetical protein